MQQYEKALFYDKHSLSTFLTLNNEESNAWAYVYIASDFIGLKQIDSAIHYLVRAKPLVEYTKDFEEKRLITERIRENYSSFFKELWSTLRVDEASYQLRIRQVFPTDISRLITFELFLVFILSVSSAAGAPPATEPPPPDKCLDICTIMAAGEITGTSGLIAASGGSYGNCFLRTNAWSAGFGGYQIFEVLKNNITITGTLPNDSRKLRVKKNYELVQEATSFAALGGGYAETKVRTRTSSEYMLVYSPVIFGSHSIKIKSMTEEYTLEKKDIALSLFNT